jgi:hypothetical protein
MRPNRSLENFLRRPPSHGLSLSKGKSRGEAEGPTLLSSAFEVSVAFGASCFTIGDTAAAARRLVHQLLGGLLRSKDII